MVSFVPPRSADWWEKRLGLAIYLFAVYTCSDLGQPQQDWLGQVQHHTNTCMEPGDRDAGGWRSIAASESDALLKARIGCRSTIPTLATAT